MSGAQASALLTVSSFFGLCLNVLKDRTCVEFLKLRESSALRFSVVAARLVPLIPVSRWFLRQIGTSSFPCRYLPLSAKTTVRLSWLFHQGMVFYALSFHCELHRTRSWLTYEKWGVYRSLPGLTKLTVKKKFDPELFRQLGCDV
ncbi:hypothetical protein Bca4012_027325 [Brassica carinata]